jgi:hypothetical protein
MQIGLGLPITRPTGGFNPRVVFGDGSNGLLWDFSTTSPLYSDNLGATPLTAPDTGVGLVADRSRVRSPVTAYGGAQASAGFKPKWGRAPVSRRNLLTYTEQFDNAAWVKTSGSGGANPTVTANNAIAPDGTMSADLVVFSAVSGVGFSIINQLVGTSLPSIILKGSAWIKAATSGDVGKTIYAYNSGVTNLKAHVLTSDYQRIDTTGVLANTTYQLIFGSVGASLGGSNQSSFGVHIWGAQLETGSTATAYQAVTSTYDMTEAGVPSYGYIRPDRTDDVLSTVLTLAQTGDVAVFGRNGSWLETARAYTAGATFSIGPTTVTGLTDGLLAALGDIVGIVAIGRTLTAAELASTLAYFKARGAAGWLTAGSELITNGGFATDLTGWSVYNGATLTLSSQRMQVANGASGRGGGAQSFATVIGQSYVFSIDVTNGSHPAFIYFGVAAGSGGTYAMSNVTGHADAVFVATAATTWVTLMPSSTGVGNTTLFDNVSVKPITVAA